MSSDATALQQSSKAMSSYAATMMPESSSVGLTGAAVSTDTLRVLSEISTVAYHMWLDNGCPVGSDQEDWLRAEAMLKNAPVARREDLSRCPSIPRGDTRNDSEVWIEFRWEGHWEVWEMEWGEARWVRD